MRRARNRGKVLPKQLEIALILQSGDFQLNEDITTIDFIKENAMFENHRGEVRNAEELEVAPTVTAMYGTGGMNTPFIKSYCIAANIINRNDNYGNGGNGVNENCTYSLTQSDIHAVFNGEMYQDKVGALLSRDYKGINEVSINQKKPIINLYGENGFAGYKESISPITASGGSLGGGSECLAVENNLEQPFNLVRRLTPLECEKLMGFPDGWTDINDAKDTPRYKALGNSIVVNCLDYIFASLVEVDKIEKDIREEFLYDE